MTTRRGSLVGGAAVHPSSSSTDRHSNRSSIMMIPNSPHGSRRGSGNLSAHGSSSSPSPSANGNRRKYMGAPPPQAPLAPSQSFAHRVEPDEEYHRHEANVTVPQQSQQQHHHQHHHHHHQHQPVNFSERQSADRAFTSCISDEDFEREALSWTEAEKREVIADLYGLHDHIRETDLDVQRTALAELEIELRMVPNADKAAFLEAKHRCPHLVDHWDHRLLFLHAESYNAERAAARLVRYWDKRVDLFGRDAFNTALSKTFRPRSKSDVEAFNMKFYKFQKGLDDFGRQIIFFDYTRKGVKYSRESLLKAFWCVIHSAIEDEVGNPTRGELVFLGGGGVLIEQFDRRFTRLEFESIHHYLPIKGVGFHFCNPPSFFYIILPYIRYVIGRRGRARLMLHDGCGREDRMLSELASYGIPRDQVPKFLGGDMEVIEDIEDDDIDERTAEALIRTYLR